jgi:hypothetical protein
MKAITLTSLALAMVANGAPAMTDLELALRGGLRQIIPRPRRQAALPQRTWVARTQANSVGRA